MGSAAHPSWDDHSRTQTHIRHWVRSFLFEPASQAHTAAASTSTDAQRIKATLTNNACSLTCSLTLVCQRVHHYMNVICLSLRATYPKHLQDCAYLLGISSASRPPPPPSSPSPFSPSHVQYTVTDIDCATYAQLVRSLQFPQWYYMYMLYMGAAATRVQPSHARDSGQNLASQA